MWSRLQEMAVRRAAPDRLEPGQSVHGVRITRHVGVIGHNRVYLGLRGRRTYLLTQLLEPSMHAFLSWQHEARFAYLPREAACLWAWEEWELGVVRPCPCIVDVRAHIDRGLPTDESLALGAALVAALERLARLGVEHRDIHPGAVLWDQAGKRLFLTGFGLSRLSGYDDYWLSARALPVHAGYAAPEMLTGADGAMPNGHAADVFAASAVLYELLSGQPPFYGGDTAMGREMRRVSHPAPLAYLAPYLPKDVAALLTSGLDPNPTGRPTLAELAAGLSGYAWPDPPGATRDMEPPAPEAVKAEFPVAAGLGRREKVMAFVAPDDRGEAVVDAVCARAAAHPAMVLFVGCTPINLPVAEAELFKSQMFELLSRRLAECRRRGLVFGLRLLDGVDVNRAAESLVDLYAPDTMLAGKPGNGFMARIRPGLVRTLERRGARVVTV